MVTPTPAYSLIRYIPADDRFPLEIELQDEWYAGQCRLLEGQPANAGALGELKDRWRAHLAALRAEYDRQLRQEVLFVDATSARDQARLRRLHRELPPVVTRLRLLSGCLVWAYTDAHPRDQDVPAVWYSPIWPKSLIAGAEDLYCGWLAQRRRKRQSPARRPARAEELTSREAAAYLGVSVDTLQRLYRAGQVGRRDTSLGGSGKPRYRYPVADLERYQREAYRREVPRPARQAGERGRPRRREYDHLDLD